MIERFRVYIPRQGGRVTTGIVGVRRRRGCRGLSRVPPSLVAMQLATTAQYSAITDLSSGAHLCRAVMRQGWYMSVEDVQNFELKLARLHGAGGESSHWRRVWTFRDCLAWSGLPARKDTCDRRACCDSESQDGTKTSRVGVGQIGCLNAAWPLEDEPAKLSFGARRDVKPRDAFRVLSDSESLGLA